MSHYDDAVRALELADYIANADRWTGDRAVDVANTLAEAQVYATLALADATEAAANIGARATYDGRI